MELIYAAYILFAVVFAIACGILAENKGRKFGEWFLLGLLLGPVALILAAVVSNLKVEERERAAAQAQAAEMAATRKCPFCAEQIRLEAVVCRYCGRDVPTVPRGAQGSFAQTAAQGRVSETKSADHRVLRVIEVIVGILAVMAVVVVVEIVLVHR